ncbi:MAG: acyl carrier protein [Thermodesulfobacteria bacterium]|nr:acyl carrier protein [Thermodesulfobacteriota bacterium]
MKREEIFETLEEILAEVLQKEVEIRPETTFEADLEVDSLKAMEILAAVEDRFDITVPINVLNEIKTVADFAEEIEKLLEEG